MTFSKRDCKAIYQSGTYDDVALYPLDVCLEYYANEVESGGGSSTLTCNSTGVKVLRRWFNTTDCDGDYDTEEFYSVGDSVECNGIDCAYAVLNRYNSYLCKPRQDYGYVALPIIMGDCVRNGERSWVRYECNSTVIRAMQYNDRYCTNPIGPTDGGVFVNGTCDNHGYQYDQIAYCDNNYPTPSPTPPTTPRPTKSPTAPTIKPIDPITNTASSIFASFFVVIACICSIAIV